MGSITPRPSEKDLKMPSKLRAVERGSANDIYYRSEMPYTWGLMSSVPRMDLGEAERLIPIPGTPPSLIDMPPGCVFRPRCTFHQHVTGGLCDTTRPDLLPVDDGHEVRCHIPSPQRKELAGELFAEVRGPGGNA